MGELLNKEEKKPSLFWSMTKSLIIFLFPGFKLMKINGQLKRINKFYKHDWFLRQRVRNTIFGLLSSMPFILSTALTFLILYKDPVLMKNLNLFQHNLTSFELIKAYDRLIFTFNNAETVSRISAIMKLQAVGFGLSFLLGSIVILFHPLIADTRKLYDLLKKNGIIDRDESNRLVLATPLGFLIDITGSSAREVQENDRIWRGMNKRIKDHSEDPQERAVVFFKQAFELQDSYIYNYTGK